MEDDILNLETRQEIFDVVLQHPGIHMREIQRKLAMHIALVEYHLNFLEKMAFIISVKEGGYRRYYPHPGNDTDRRLKLGYEERRMLGVLRQKIPLQVTLLLLTKKHATHSEISAELNISPSKLSYHLKKLLRVGIVKQIRHGENRGYSIMDERKIHMILLAYKPHKDMFSEFSDMWSALDVG